MNKVHSSSKRLFTSCLKYIITIIIERLMAMAQIGAIQKHYSREEDVNISYLTEDIKDVLHASHHFWNG